MLIWDANHGRRRNFFCHFSIVYDRPWHKPTKMMNCPHCESLVQGNIMKFWSPCWMYESLLSSLPLWSNYTKSEKQSAVKGCCEYPPPQSRCWGWQPQEVTSLHLGYLLILQTVISLPTLPLLVALLLILEKSFYIAQVGGWYLFYGTSLSKFWKKLVIFMPYISLTLPANNIPTFSLYFVWESCL